MWRLWQRRRAYQGAATHKRFSLATAAARIVMGVASIGVFWSGGCGRAAPQSLAPYDTGGLADSAIDQVIGTLERLRRSDDFRTDILAMKLTTDLDFWAQQQSAAAWEPDPLVSKVSKRMQPIVAPARLSRMQFSRLDIEHIKESAWVAAVATQIEERVNRVGPDSSWLKPQLERLSAEAAHDLRLAEQLFDWVVRNIQLDALRPIAKGEMAGPLAPDASPTQAKLEAGPGYTHVPWQTLLIGHGDKLERSRLFGLLCQQQHLVAVDLALDIDDGSGRLRPWCTGVFIDKEIYLFDCELGLGLPDAGGAGIVTLSKVMADPAVLRQLDLDEHKYPVGGDEVKTIVALVNASPTALSRRMQLLKDQLPATFPWALTVKPSEIAESLRGVAGIRDARLSSIPLEADYFRERTLAIGRSGLTAEESIFENIPEFMKARLSHLRGEYEQKDDVVGAIKAYMSMRVPDEEIEGITKSPTVRRRLGIPEDAAPPNERKRYFALAQQLARSRKRNASYWLGIVQWERGAFEVAEDWFANRTLLADPESEWTSGARYNLGRTYESLGDTKQAIATYKQSKSPQRHGDLLRARRLATSLGGEKMP